MLVCAATPCGNVLATRVIHYYDNLLHACLCSVTLRKRIDNRLIHYCEKHFVCLFFQRHFAEKYLPVPYNPLLR